MSRNSQRGLTLIETLVALAIMGFVAASILVLVGQNTRFAAAARDRTYAAIVADNVMVREMALAGPIEVGEIFGETELAGRAWPYRVTIVETAVAGVLRIDVDVFDEEGGQVIASALTLRKVQ